MPYSTPGPLRLRGFLYGQAMRITDSTHHLTLSGTVPGLPRDPVTGGAVLRLESVPAVVADLAAAGVSLVPGPRVAAWLARAAERAHVAALRLAEAPECLFGYQREGVGFLASRDVAYLFDDMGLGKTVQALCAIDPGRPALVVCPASLRDNWASECRKWRPDIAPVVVASKSAFRWPEPGELVVVSYHGTPPAPDKVGKFPRGLQLIADECHAVKRLGASRKPVQTTKRFRLIARRVAKYGGQTWMMSGTPVMNNPADLWGLLQATRLGTPLYRSRDRFNKIFGGWTDGLGQVLWNPKKIHEDAMGPTAGIVLRRKREDELDLPAKSHRTREVSIATSRDMRAALKAAENHPIFETLQDAAWAGDDVSEVDGAYFSELMAARRLLAQAKIPALLAVVEEFREVGEPLVVFSAHRGPVEALGDLEGWGAVHGGVTGGRQSLVDAFQAGRLRGLALTIGAGGTGFTLTRACHALFVDRAWTPAENAQAEDRISRIGQTRPVTITDLVADHAVDRRLHAVLRTKVATTQRTTEQTNGRIHAPDYTALAAELRDLAAHAGAAT